MQFFLLASSLSQPSHSLCCQAHSRWSCSSVTIRCQLCRRLGRRAEVVLLVLDGQACAPDGRLAVAQQDFRLAELVAEQGRACVLVVNKWDAVAGKDSDTLARARAELLQQLRPLAWATVVFTSAVTGAERAHARCGALPAWRAVFAEPVGSMLRLWHSGHVRSA